MSMNGKFLLDTNIAIAVFARDTSIQQRLIDAAETFLSVTVVGELYYGAYNSSRVAENIVRT